MTNGVVNGKAIKITEERQEIKSSGVKANSQLKSEQKKIKKIKSPAKSKLNGSEVSVSRESEAKANVLKESDERLAKTQ